MVEMIPVKPSFIVDGKDGLWTSILEAADEGLQTGDCPSNELAAAERLQAAAMLSVVLLDHVIDAHCWVAVCHVEATTCRNIFKTFISFYYLHMV